MLLALVSRKFFCAFQKHLLFLHANNENHGKEETYIHQLRLGTEAFAS